MLEKKSLILYDKRLIVEYFSFDLIITMAREIGAFNSHIITQQESLLGLLLNPFSCLPDLCFPFSVLREHTKESLIHARRTRNTIVGYDYTEKKTCYGTTNCT